jgi:hypothetical protein
MSKYQVCGCCGQKVYPKIHCYYNGDGCLSLIWRCGKDEIAPARKVTKAQAQRYLMRKENKHLFDRNWLPVQINGRWKLARYVKRTGPNRLNIDGHVFYYSGVKPATRNGRIWDCDLKVTFKMRVKGKLVEHEMQNISIRGEIRFFLENEAILKPQFKGFNPVKGELL